MSISTRTNQKWIYLCPQFEKGKEANIRKNDMSKALKLKGTKLTYPEIKRIDVKYRDTHYLISGGSNTLNLVGYKKREINKIRRWQPETLKENISDQLYSFYKGI